MNIYDFINSSAIREHCIRIGHTFNSVECAYIVWQSEKTIKEKHAAYQEIIDTMPDMQVEILGYKEKEYVGLHDVLRKGIRYENDAIALFKAKDGGVYTNHVYWNDEWRDFCIELHSDWQKCFDDMAEGYEEEWENHEIPNAYIEKIWIDDARRRAELHFNPDKEPDMIYVECVEELGEDPFDIFDNVWINIPTPFEKGDIVYSRVSDKGPFVIQYMTASESEERIKKLMESGCPDIIVNGYFKNDDFKNVYMDHVNNYYNLEYYTDELKGTQKVLKPISAYMKGEIDFLYLLNAYTVIMQESEAAGMREYLKHYDEWYKNVLLK